MKKMIRNVAFTAALLATAGLSLPAYASIAGSNPRPPMGNGGGSTATVATAILIALGY